MRPAAEVGGEPIAIPNEMEADMKQNWAERGEYHGYFVLRGIKYGTRNFDDYWIFANNLSKEGFDTLVSINNTLEAHPMKDFNKIRTYLDGFIRDIYYTSHDSSSPPDFSAKDKNKIIYVYEGYYQNGVLQ